MSMAVERFLSELKRRGLFTADEIAALSNRLPQCAPQDDAREIVRWFVEQRRLTLFQARAVYERDPQPLVLGNYVLLDRIGAGGMGQVFKAMHRRMERVVALKVLPNLAADDPDAVARFHREMKAAARLSHPNIVAAHDADEAEGLHFLVMEYVEGVDLSEYVRRKGPLDPATAVECIVQAARGLEHAHELGVVHRDIKPGNLLLQSTEGRGAGGQRQSEESLGRSTLDPGSSTILKILDMGLARFQSAGNNPDATEAELTHTGAVMGTVDYMSPEQALDTKTADERADVYSLGCTLYFLLTGRPVYGGSTLMKRLVAHREEPIPSLRDRNAEASEALDAVFRKMVAKTPENRYQSMGEVAAELDACREPDSSVGIVSLQPQADAGISEFLAGSDALASRGGAATQVSEADSVDTLASVKRDETVVTPGRRKRVSQPHESPLKLKWADWRILAGVAVGAVLLIAISIWTYRAIRNPGSDDPGGPRANSSSSDRALRFDPQRGSHVVCPLPDLDGNDPITVELTVTLSEDRVCNTINWMGRQWLAVFYADGRWGVGKLTDNGPQLVRTVEAAALNRRTHLAATWDGRDARLFVDGRPMETVPLSFPLQPTRGGLFIGGAPVGLLPGHDSDRWVAGAIDEVRISRGVRYTEAYPPQERLAADENTLALYHFDEPDGEQAIDSSSHARHGRLVEVDRVPTAEN